MQNNYILKALIFVFLFGSGFMLKANVDTVMVGPNNTMTFSPTNFTISLGDTVLWMWESGVHTTTSTSIPAGATSWDEIMNSGNTTFMYVPAVVGTYDYKCTPHAPSMVGSFTVISSTGLKEISANRKLNISPSIGDGVFKIEDERRIGEDAILSVFNLNGQLILKKSLKESSEIVDIRGEASGFYTIQLNTSEKRYQASYIKE